VNAGNVVDFSTSEDERRKQFSAFLRRARLSIPVESISLGSFVRRPERVGKVVSQEEFAEAIGVSRVWYATLEGCRVAQPSVALLERISDALMLDERQRLRLVELAIPELSQPAIELRHTAIIESSALIRDCAKKLWTASSVDEALLLAAEQTATLFPDAELVFFPHRRAPGVWEYPFVVDEGLGSRNAECFVEMASSLKDAFDEIALYPTISEPGAVGTMESFGRTRVAPQYKESVAKYRLEHLVFVHARIRSRSGIVAGITAKHTGGRAYSEVERASIGAIAALTSLVLP
jgi:transcriptional regulator with XRE-family HTH domain